jgi:cohesin complex subunit SCC1
MTMQTSRSAITLPYGSTNAFDLSLPDPMFEGWDVNSVAGGSASRQNTPRSFRSQSYTARLEDISLPRFTEQQQPGGRFAAWRGGDIFDADGGQGVALDQAVQGEAVRRDSQGREVDANGDLVESDGSSIGVARDAPSQAGRPSLGLGDLTGFDDFPMMGGAEMEGGFDLGLEEFDAARQRSTTPTNQTYTQSLMQDLTPRTALKVQQAAEKRAAATTTDKSRKQVVDSRTELQDVSSNQARLANLLTDERYLPRSKAYMQLLEFHANPARHVLPFTSATGGIFMGSRGLDPKLSELFTMDATTLRRQRSPSVDAQDEERGEKRLRRESGVEGDMSMEIGRRAEGASVQGGDLTGLALDTSYDDAFGGEGDEVPFDLTNDPVDTSAVDLGLRRSLRKRVTEPVEPRVDRNAFDVVGNLPRLATPSVMGESEVQGSVRESPSSSNLLRAFDNNVQSEAPYVAAAETQESTQSGLSKNTIRAIKVLRKEFGQEEQEDDAGEEEQAEKQLSFQQITTNATRRAAAGFFFELLVLGTKDCIKVEQHDSFGDIAIRAKPNLWTEEIQAGPALASAPVS